MNECKFCGAEIEDPHENMCLKCEKEYQNAMDEIREEKEQRGE